MLFRRYKRGEAIRQALSAPFYTSHATSLAHDSSSLCIFDVGPESFCGNTLAGSQGKYEYTTALAKPRKELDCV